MADLATIFALMLAGHALADYPLQGDFLAKAKNRANPIPGKADAKHSLARFLRGD